MSSKHSFNRRQLAVKNTAPKKINRKSAPRDHAFAFGFSLPLAFPLADQQALGYNFRGGSNTVSDYIPSPHLQYHLNRKTYFQTEIQVVAPQYIRPILMYQQKSNDQSQYLDVQFCICQEALLLQPAGFCIP